MVLFQLSLTKFVKPISREERELELKKVSESFVQASSREALVEIVSNPPIKKKIGCPQKVPSSSMTILNLPVFATPSVPPPLDRKRKEKRRRSYTNWFATDKRPLIEAIVKQHQSMSAALHYLKVAHR